jgi:lipoprotein-releasing system permease protein
MPGIVIGRTLAENMSIKLGDGVQVTTPLIGLDVLGWEPSEDTPRSLTFKVVGLFYAGFLEYDTKLAYVDYYQAQRFFNHGDAVTGVELTLHDRYLAKKLGRKIKKILGEGPYHTVDWMMLNEHLFTALMIQKTALTMVLAVIVGVAAFNIIATLVMMVFDKRREIAILKSMGATRRGIARIFLHVGLFVGLIGISIGLIVGFGVCLLLHEVGWPLDPGVYLIDHLPVRLEWTDFVVTAGIAFIICQLATVLPALSASNLKPVDGLRQD